MKKWIVLAGVSIAGVVVADVSIQKFQGIGAYNATAKAKLDSNFTNVKSAIVDLQAGGGATVSFTSLVVTSATTAVATDNIVYLAAPGGGTNTVTLTLTTGKQATFVVGNSGTNAMAVAYNGGTATVTAHKSVVLLQGSGTNRWVIGGNL